jgi:cytochrome o ubiquinol oxidase subunit 3
MSEIAITKQEINVLETEKSSKTLLGFWIYIMTDCILFASLFAVYAVLHKNNAGGATTTQLFNLPYVLVETLALLTSSFTCGLAMLSLRKNDKEKVIFWLGVTFALGLLFLGLELSEFKHLVETGNSWRASGFLSSYFTLVGTHGIHITIGLLWMLVMIVKIFTGKLTKGNIRRLTLLSLFWHFLDVIWIFIFTIVYLMGALGV